ncbi:MAG: c-type cytochrome [Gammaproteobacteria bacterium]
MRIGTFYWVGCFAACLAAGSAQERSAQRTFDEAEVTQGREIYNRSCTLCHGIDGTEGDRAPALAARRRYLRAGDEDLFDAIKHGIGGTLMPPANLPEADVRKVVAYIRSLRAPASNTAVKGDAARGAEVFWGKGNCGSCHMVRGKGDILGPDLSNVGGERRLNYLRDVLTQPRPHVPRGYQPVRVTTRDGRTLEGIVKNESNFSVQVLGLDRALRLYTRDELKEVVYQKESLMPSNYDQRLTGSELQDLLAFLSRLARNLEHR